MAGTKKQKDNFIDEEEQGNAPNNDRTTSGNQQISQGNRIGDQDTRNKPEENPQPGRRR
jgi:hypothetical protein